VTAISVLPADVNVKPTPPVFVVSRKQATSGEELKRSTNAPLLLQEEKSEEKPEDKPKEKPEEKPKEEQDRRDRRGRSV
jgi:hypothetical protein